MFLSGVPYSHFSAHDFIAIIAGVGKVSGPPSMMRQEVRNLLQLPPEFSIDRDNRFAVRNGVKGFD